MKIIMENIIYILSAKQLSEEAKARHEKRMLKNKERIEKMKEDVRSGKYDHLINQLHGTQLGANEIK